MHIQSHHRTTGVAPDVFSTARLGCQLSAVCMCLICRTHRDSDRARPPGGEFVSIRGRMAGDAIDPSPSPLYVRRYTKNEHDEGNTMRHIAKNKVNR